jgi:hypothetical protein
VIPNQRRLLILDAGPIRELVVYRAVNELDFNKLSGELRHFADVTAYTRFSAFLSSFQHRTTSASVVAELYQWIRNTDAAGRKDLWQLTFEEFKNSGLDEHLIKLLDMDIDLVSRYGPTDVSLMEIARSNSSISPLILTLDGRLHSECWNQQIEAELLSVVCDAHG